MKTITTIFLSILFLTVGCSSHHQDRERLKRPSYLTMNTELLNGSNDIMWEMNCGDFRVSVSDGSFDDFYKEDKSLKTQREYCDFARERIRTRR